jgi:hypothetical protein
MTKRSSKKPNGGKTLMKTFRIPKELDDVLSEAARENNTSLTDQYVSVLRNYVKYDRLARKFGFVSLSKAALRALMEALTEDELRKVAASQSVRVEALSEFFFKKKDLGSVLGVIDLLSKYGSLFEYTTAQKERELIITLRTDLGSKGAVYLAEYWEPALGSIVGPVRRVEIVENQVTFWLTPKKLESSS